MKYLMNHFMRLALLVIAAMLPQLASAYDFMVDDIAYNYNDDGMSVTVTFGSYYSGSVDIPLTVTNNGTTFLVTAIGDEAFVGSTYLTSVTIPNSVRTIGDYAFRYCFSLTSVTIPNSVTSIGKEAFNNCTRLASVTIGNSLTEISFGAFSDCKSLTSIDIPNSVTKIGQNAFARSGLTSVTIGNSVETIDFCAFDGCTSLTSVNISDIAAWCGIQFDSEYCNPLYYAHNLYLNGEKVTDLVIPNSVTKIMPIAFCNCTGLTSVTIPNSVTSIGGGAFEGCTGLTSISIPNSVTSIGGSAFEGCTGLTSISIPNSVTSIGNYAFAYCSGLTSVTIPNSVTSIGNYAFAYCSGLTSISTPNSVTSIGDYAFYNCSSLALVTILNSATSIGSNAFSGTAWYDNQQDGVIYAGNIACGYKGTMPEGTSITLKDDCTGIAGSAFYESVNMTSVTIPPTMKSIGKDAFAGCTGLTSVNISDIAAWCGIDFWNGSANPLRYAHNLYLNGEKVTDLVIPNTVTTIPFAAFYGCSGLKSVTIPNSVTEILKSAFYGCTGLSSLIIPKSVTWLGYYAFSGCPGLSSINVDSENPIFNSNNNCNAIIETSTNTLCFGCKNTIIPNSVQTICSTAFYECTGLTSVTIPNSVTSIGDVAFYACSGLNSITIPNSVTEIGNSAFNYCTGLTSVVWLAKRCNDFDYFSSPFINLTNIESFTFGGEMERIPAFICYGLSGLTSITIPNSVTSIGESAFSCCNGLTSVYSKIKVPESVVYGSYVFYDVPSTCLLYVPKGKRDIYSTISPWSNFSNIVEMPHDGDVNNDGHITSVDITALYNYLLDGDSNELVDGDVDGDGHITSVDITSVYNMLLGNN